MTTRKYKLTLSFVAHILVVLVSVFGQCWSRKRVHYKGLPTASGADCEVSRMSWLCNTTKVLVHARLERNRLAHLRAAVGEGQGCTLNSGSQAAGAAFLPPPFRWSRKSLKNTLKTTGRYTFIINKQWERHPSLEF